MSGNIRTAFFCGVIGASFVFHAGKGLVSDAHSLADPQRISCMNLALGGPGENLHVVLTDFEVSEAYVVEDRHKDVWIQAFPAGAQGGLFCVLLKANWGERLEVFDSSEIRGTVRKASSFHLEGDVLEKLNLKDPWVLEVGVGPGSLVGSLVMIAIGVGFLAIAVMNFRKTFRPASILPTGGQS